MDVETISLQSWSEYKDLIGRVVCDGAWGQEPERYWFRGHADAGWSLTSSFDRLFAGADPAVRRTIHQAMLDALQERLDVSEDDALVRIRSELRDETSSPVNEIAALAQHFGAPTRMLDWTESAYIAAFFAFSDFGRATESSSALSDADCAVVVLDTSAAAWNSDSGVSLVSGNRRSNPRLRRQRGVFTLNSSVSHSLEQYCRSFYTTPSEEVPLRRLILPKSSAPGALRDLEMMGITSESMFPGVEGAARYAFVRAVDRHVWRAI